MDEVNKLLDANLPNSGSSYSLFIRPKSYIIGRTLYCDSFVSLLIKQLLIGNIHHIHVYELLIYLYVNRDVQNLISFRNKSLP